MKTRKQTTTAARRFNREAIIEREHINAEARTLRLAFSSEEPVERYYPGIGNGNEVLDHGRGADFSRLNNRAPVLVNHNPNDQVGVVEKASMDGDKVGRAVVRFSKSARAQEIFEDILDGIRGKVSVGYEVLSDPIKEEPEGEPRGLTTLRVLEWQPLEISIVSIPADDTVGVGRAAGAEPQPEEKQPMAEKTVETTPTPQVDVEVVREEARKDERKRREQINHYKDMFKDKCPKVVDLAQRAIMDDMPVGEFQRLVLDEINNEVKDLGRPLGMSEREVKRYSISKAILNFADKRWGGLEKEVSDAYEKQLKRTPGSFWIPPDVVLGGRMGRRDLLAGTATSAQELVPTIHDGASFIDVLRARMMVGQMGATTLDGLSGTVVIPRKTSSGTAGTWAASEAANATESTQQFDQVTLSPNTVSNLTDYSKLLLIQGSPSVDALVRDDLAVKLAQALDVAALHGSGSSGQPTGVINVSGIGSVTGGANGANPDWQDIVNLEAEVANDNAVMGAMGYLTNTRVRAWLKGGSASATGKYPSLTFDWIWGDNALPGDGITETLNGYRAGVSNNVSNTLTKGTSTTVCSAIFFGNWADLLIGQWGGVDILVDPYSQSQARLIRVVASLFADIQVRHAESFSCMPDALTT